MDNQGKGLLGSAPYSHSQSSGFVARYEPPRRFCHHCSRLFYLGTHTPASTVRFCSDSCRQAAYRRGFRGVSEQLPPQANDHGRRQLA